MSFRGRRTLAIAGLCALAGCTSTFSEPEVVLYDTQPMVVDVVLDDVADDVTVAVVTEDEGVTSEDLGIVDGRRTVRVRGLAPETDYDLELLAPGYESLGFSTTTLAPLEGFVPNLTATGDLPIDGYALIDMAIFPPGAEDAGVMLVDAQGITRWFHSTTSTSVGPPAVRGAARLLDDGTVCTLHDYNILCVDELGVSSVRLDYEEADAAGFHHELLVKDDGGFFVMGYTFRDVPDEEFGMLPFAGDEIIEFSPEGEVLWRWDTFDHLDTERRRTGIETAIPDPRADDPDIFGFDWTHGNGMVYEPETDSLLISLRHQDWLVRVDHGSGDVVWRLGEDGDFDLEEGTWFFHQHSPQWQADGSLLLYDNGVDNPNIEPEAVRSRAVRYEIDEASMTVRQVWEDDEEPFVSALAGDADVLPNGDYMVLDSFMQRDEETLGARIRVLDPGSSPMKQAELTGPDNHFIYRASIVDRYVSPAP